MAITQLPPSAPTPSPDDADAHAPGDKEMTLLEHLEELRGRLVACVLALVAGVGIAFIPIPGYNSVTGLLFDALVNQAKATGVLIISITPGETFFTYLEVALVIGAAIAMPMIIYQVLAFVSPALYANEKK